jgi:hypothetical protein
MLTVMITKEKRVGMEGREETYASLLKAAGLSGFQIKKVPNTERSLPSCGIQVKFRLNAQEVTDLEIDLGGCSDQEIETFMKLLSESKS